MRLHWQSATFLSGHSGHLKDHFLSKLFSQKTPGNWVFFFCKKALTAAIVLKFLNESEQWQKSPFESFFFYEDGPWA